MRTAECTRSDRRQSFRRRRTGQVGTLRVGWWRGPGAAAAEAGSWTATGASIRSAGRPPSPRARTGRAGTSPRAWAARTSGLDRDAEARPAARSGNRVASWVVLVYDPRLK